MTDLLLFWHRRDLRLEDNQGLAMACDRSPQVVGVFCFDPQIYRPMTWPRPAWLTWWAA
jgi:deoxyribodipyrimidine photo-lyase